MVLAYLLWLCIRVYLFQHTSVICRTPLIRVPINEDSYSQRDCTAGKTDATVIQMNENGTYLVRGNTDVFDAILLDFQDLFIDSGRAFAHKRITRKRYKDSVGVERHVKAQMKLSEKRINIVKYNFEDRQKSPCPYYMRVAYIPGTNIGYTEYICNDTQLNTLPDNMVCAQMYTYRLFRYRGRNGSGRNRTQIIKTEKVRQKVGCELRFAANRHNKNCFPKTPDTRTKDIC